MKKNVGSEERIIRIIAGAAILSLAFVGPEEPDPREPPMLAMEPKSKGASRPSAVTKPAEDPPV